MLPDECEWNDFGAWTQCSATCGSGTTTRTRTVKTPYKNIGKPWNLKKNNG